MATKKAAAGGILPNTIQIAQGLDSKINLPEDMIVIFDYFLCSLFKFCFIFYFYNKFI
jgi:hypothetical protein